MISVTAELVNVTEFKPQDKPGTVYYSLVVLDKEFSPKSNRLVEIERVINIPARLHNHVHSFKTAINKIVSFNVQPRIYNEKFQGWVLDDEKFVIQSTAGIPKPIA